MIKPTTYSEWSDCIEIFENGSQDDEVVFAMFHGTLDWTSGVANLFSERIHGAFNIRLQRCADRMTRDFNAGGNETDMVRTMLDTRRMLTLLYRVASLPSFQNSLRELLTDEVRKYAERTQQSLEDSAMHDRSGKLVSLLRNNSLLRYHAVAERSAPASTQSKPIGAGESSNRPTPKRNILL